MRSRVLSIFALSACLGLVVACDKGEDSDGEAVGDGDGDGEPGDGDGEPGDGDGEPGDGDGEPGDGDGESECEELAMGDALIPGDCRCVDPKEPCTQGCFFPDGVITCAEVCAELGESCVEDGCGSGFTYLEGTPAECPVPSEYGSTHSLGCDEPVPIIDWPYPDFETIGASCCCTQP